MNAHDKQYKALTLRLGFAVLLLFVLLQGLMTALGLAQLVMVTTMTEKAANVLYWGLYNVFYLVSFMLPVPFFMLIRGKIKTEKMFFGVRFPKRFALLALSCVGLITAVGQINSLLLAPFSGDGSASTDIMMDLMGSDKSYMVVLIFVMLVIVPPFCEEFLFRGLILGNLLPYGKGVAIVGSALLFGAMHQSFSQFLYTVAAGVLLGMLYAESRSIWPSTLVHMLNNMVSFIQLVIMSRVEDEMLASRIVISMNLAVIGLGLICTVILLIGAKNQKKTPDLSHGAFDTTPDSSYFASPVALSPGMAVRGFFSPSVAVFIVISFVMAFFNLLAEALV